MLVNLLCRQHCLPMPSEFDELIGSNGSENAGTNSDSGKESHDASEESADEEDFGDDDDEEIESDGEEMFKMEGVEHSANVRKKKSFQLDMTLR